MNLEILFKKIAQGLALGVIISIIYLMLNKNYSVGEILLYEILPGFKMQEDVSLLFKPTLSESENDEISLLKKEDIINDDSLLHLTDIEFQDETTPAAVYDSPQPTFSPSLQNLTNLEELRKHYYIVDNRTVMTANDFDIQALTGIDLKIQTNTDEPKVLVFHTHAHENFKDSAPQNPDHGVLGAGKRLCDNLESYGIKTMHVTERFDMANGKSSVTGAYERMEPRIRQILAENPSIEMVIDLHRDGVQENVHLVENINGKPTAQIMFFNGLCKLNENGQATNINGLPNPYIQTNLALSFNLKRKADELYPNLTRKIYLNAYRYSLHMLPKSTLIELGAQTNTEEEISNAVDLLAEIIADVIT